MIVDNNVEAVTWKDKKSEFTEYIYAFEQELQVKRKQNDGSTKKVKCPTSVRRYNIFMGGVDLCDQYRKVLSCSRKSIKWYMRLVWFFLILLIFVSPMLLFGRKRVKLVRNEHKNSSGSI